jgi:hypothetical protein
MCTEIAALLSPLPGPGDENADEIPYGPIEAERGDHAETLRVSWEEGGIDPLLSTLEHLRQERLRLEEDMRLLIAYGRRFIHPRPYKLIDLANAAGMSISGVRTAYDDEEVNQAAEILGRGPVQPAAGGN